MEPRPPRPRPTNPADRTSHPAEGASRAATALYPGGQPDAAPYAPTVQAGYAGGAPPQASEIPLLPRQQRRRRRLIQMGLVALLLLGGLGAGGYYLFGDRFTDEEEPAPQVAAVASPAATAAPSSSATEPAADPAPTEPPPGGVAARAPTATNEALDAPATEPAAEETEAPARSTRPTRQAADTEPEPAESGELPPLEELLPTADEVPAGLVAGEVATRTEEEVIENLNTEDASDRLTEWGWSGNVFQEFNGAPEELPPGSTSYLVVSNHRFGTADAASQALPYFSDLVVAQQGLEEFPVEEPIGDEIRALQAVGDDGTTNVVVYVVDGVDLIRIGGSSADGEPQADVLAVAQIIVDK